LPYANADCPYGAILMNIYWEIKTEFSRVRFLEVAARLTEVAVK
jgi:hypothetical protein